MVIATEGPRDGAACCEDNPCANTGLVLVIPPSQPQPPSLTALCTLSDPVVVDRCMFDNAAFMALLHSSTPLYIQKSVLIC